VKARNRSPHALSLIAREIDVGASMLEDFAAGRGNLSVEVLKALTKVLYDAEFDPESGMLRSANKAEPAMFALRTLNSATPNCRRVTGQCRQVRTCPDRSPWCRKSRSRSVAGQDGSADFGERRHSDRRAGRPAGSLPSQA